MKTGIELIAKERLQKIEVEGYTAENDLLYTKNQLALAAVFHALPQKERGISDISGDFSPNFIALDASALEIYT